MVFLFDSLVKISMMKQYILSTLTMHLTEIKAIPIMDGMSYHNNVF